MSATKQMWHRPGSERIQLGKGLRSLYPLQDHARCDLGDHRDPVGLLLKQCEGRVKDLIPIRNQRMLVSPFAFYRGAAVVMAADLAAQPHSELWAQLCGDAHLVNFGAYASRERRLVFDINDFDESRPGPFEWDVKRLAASVIAAGRENGFDSKINRRAAVAGVAAYRTAMREFADQSILDVWYSHIDIDTQFEAYRQQRKSTKQADKKMIKVTESALARARKRDNLQAVKKLTTRVDGRRRIAASPPLTTPLDQLAPAARDDNMKLLEELLRSYRSTLPHNRRELLDHFRLIDAALHVVGVGSVGTRTWILLLEGNAEQEALMLQAKEATASVLDEYLPDSEFDNQGERVVCGQRLMQASSDIFLGWVRNNQPDGAHDYYLRQLRDWKMSAPIDAMSPSGLRSYSRLCGATLARAHARSGDRIMIAGYLGQSDTFDEAIGDFAESYADQTEKDYSAFAKQVGAPTDTTEERRVPEHS
jgi:uncharacterized protein (DUF2252 family)